MSFRPFTPADGPPWLPRFADSIAGLFRRILPAPLRLRDYAAADLPAAADHAQGLAYDSSDDRLSYSDGSGWIQLAAFDADVAAYGALSTTGLVARTGAGSVATRTLTAPAAGITVTNGNGVAGNPTLALADDLAALEALSITGVPSRTGTNAWVLRSITGTTGQVTVTNGGGVLGPPTISLPSVMTAPGTLGAATALIAPDGSVIAGGANGLYFASFPDTGMAANASNLSLRESGVITANLSETEGSLRVHSGIKIGWSSAANNNAAIDTYLERMSAGNMRASGGFEAQGELRCDTFRIDVAPTAAAIAQTHHVPININGTAYKLLLAS